MSHPKTCKKLWYIAAEVILKHARFSVFQLDYIRKRLLWEYRTNKIVIHTFASSEKQATLALSMRVAQDITRQLEMGPPKHLRRRLRAKRRLIPSVQGRRCNQEDNDYVAACLYTKHGIKRKRMFQYDLITFIKMMNMGTSAELNALFVEHFLVQTGLNYECTELYRAWKMYARQDMGEHYSPIYRKGHPDRLKFWLIENPHLIKRQRRRRRDEMLEFDGDDQYTSCDEDCPVCEESECEWDCII